MTDEGQTPEEKHDEETREHIRQVRHWMFAAGRDLRARAEKHDASKLEEPERSVFAEVNKDGRPGFGTPEYEQRMVDLGPALDHHFDTNDHHPEYWGSHDPYARAGTLVSSMSLNAILEMLCDWKARAGDDILPSIDACCERFGIGLQLKAILLNTANELGMLYEHQPAFLVTESGSTAGRRDRGEGDADPDGSGELVGVGADLSEG